MLTEILVAVACNLIAFLILISGIFTAKSNGIRVTLVKFFGVVGALVGIYFLTPVVSDALFGINGVSTFVKDVIGASVGTVNSCIFFLLFIFAYLIIAIICSIVKHCLMKKLQDKKANKIKMKRAKSINPKAERMVKKAEWKAVKAKWAENNRWYYQILSCFVGAIIAVVIGIVTLMPYEFIAKDINHDGSKEYLIKGFEYTLNDQIPDSFFDSVTHNK